MEYNLEHVDTFVFNNAKNAIKCAIECYGLMQFLDKLNKSKVRPNPKYTALIEKYKHHKDDFEELCENATLDGTNITYEHFLPDVKDFINDTIRNNTDKADSK